MASSVESWWVYDEKVVNGQKCVDEAVESSLGGDLKTVHYHRKGETCNGKCTSYLGGRPTSAVGSGAE